MDNHADALVFFGVTGDLAYKKIFPALHAMIKRKTLSIPVIGVARDDYTPDKLKERARASINEHGGGVDEAAFAALEKQLSYVKGDYSDDKTFATLHDALKGARPDRLSTWRSRPCCSGRWWSTSPRGIAARAPG